MVDKCMNIEFSKDEIRNIIFPENPVICRSCHKPRINKKLSVADFSQEHREKICTVGKYHGPYHQNNPQNIIPNNVQNNNQNNPQNIAPNNAQYEIHHVEDVHVVHNIDPNLHQGVNQNMQNNPLNAQNYVTRNEFIAFKESINERFDRLERGIQALGGGNLNNEAEEGEEEKGEDEGEEGGKEEDEDEDEGE